jgi:hypothetical protein
MIFVFGASNVSRDFPGARCILCVLKTTECMLLPTNIVCQLKILTHNKRSMNEHNCLMNEMSFDDENWSKKQLTPAHCNIMNVWTFAKQGKVAELRSAIASSVC